MPKPAAACALTLSVFFGTVCDDAKSNVAAPTAFDVSDVSLDVTAGTPVATSGDRSCAAALPFTVPIDLSVRAGGLDVTVTDVTARFVDTFGIPMPPVTLPAPVLTTQFGSMLIAARTERTIPLIVPVGCTNDPRGTIVVVVGTRDGRGHGRSTETRSRVH